MYGLDKNDFKSTFRYYKQKLANYKDIITFDDISCSEGRTSRVALKQTQSPPLLGVKNVQDWKVYSLHDHPGLLIIRNSFTNLGQRYWITRCLRDFPRKPNKRNVDIDSVLSDVDNVWDYCTNTDFKIIDKLRWATLGYHHNWDTKEYSENSRGEFPPDLAFLSEHYASAVGYPTFKAEAAIVNMYHPRSSLSGHTDHSEVDLEAPLLSFSFGQSAIFLIGGYSLEEPTTAIMLSSGDVMAMSRSARLSYHAVPRIVPSHSKPWELSLTPSEEVVMDTASSRDVIDIINDDTAWRPFHTYVSRSRININVRQVLPSGWHTLQGD